MTAATPDWDALGLRPEEARLVPYDPRWPDWADAVTTQIAAVSQPWITCIEHVGSTAVPHLAAKPIIDLMPGLTSLADGPHIVQPIERLGYEYLGEFGIPGRLYFRKRIDGRSVVHVHVFEVGSDEWRRHLLFRDHLRDRPDAARQYEALKHELASQHANDRTAYTDAKTAFIESAIAESGGPPRGNG